MATGWSATAANHVLDTEGALYSWIKLHIGDPGSAGTGNPAVNTTRKQATWGAAAGGVISNTNILSWTSVPATEDYTHYTVWTASSGGVFGWSGTITADSAVINNDFVAGVGDIDNSISVAS